ncbi:hypothetical protein FFF34_003260 [Inquilinus sp. KBS0705]|nr:hypothetical protein FFF34_003260 [Inquilinus sp. KBS0705]
MINENNPLNMQGDINEQQDQLGGTTNLSLDELKQGNDNNTEDNPDEITNQDDLHEIQAGDDLNEPDAEGIYSNSNPEPTNQTPETDEGQNADF